MESERIKNTPISINELKKLSQGVFSEDKILEEIQLIQNYFDDRNLDLLNIGIKKSNNKLTLLEALVKLRKIYFKNTPEALEAKKRFVRRRCDIGNLHK